jgi:hypothetical protein
VSIAYCNTCSIDSGPFASRAESAKDQQNRSWRDSYINDF